MDKAMGVLKLAISVFLAIACVVVLFNIRPDANAATYLGVLIMVIMFGFYIYYLITTGINSIKSEPYRLRVIPIVGLLVHFLFMVSIIITSFQPGGMQNVLTSIAPVIAGGVILVLDVKKYLAIWKGRNVDQISN